jgi:hypothetical protein
VRSVVLSVRTVGQRDPCELTGYILAGAIWTNAMPGNLGRHLPFLSEEERQVLYGSIVSAAAKPRGDPTREGVILGAFCLTICH